MDFWAGIEQIKSDYKVFYHELEALKKPTCLQLLERSNELCFLKRRLQDLRQVLPADETQFQAEYRFEQMMITFDKKLAKLQEAIGKARERESKREEKIQTLEQERQVCQRQGKTAKVRDIDDQLLRIRARIAS